MIGMKLPCPATIVFAVSKNSTVDVRFVTTILGSMPSVRRRSSNGSITGLWSFSYTTWTDRQRRMLTNWMKQTYEQFTDRILTTRKDKIKDIDLVAHGRIFLAKDAKALGMVDELGGIDSAVTYAAGKAELKPGEYDVRVFPQTRTLADLLAGGDEDAAMPFRPQTGLEMTTMLRTLSPSAAKLLTQQLQVLELFQRRPVVLVSPFVISVK